MKVSQVSPENVCIFVSIHLDRLCFAHFRSRNGCVFASVELNGHDGFSRFLLKTAALFPLMNVLLLCQTPTVGSRPPYGWGGACFLQKQGGFVSLSSKKSRSVFYPQMVVVYTFKMDQDVCL